ncbi:glycerol-3-phosphate dehydrogenase subunit GlpB [Edaphovirga cremea]|uniref:glycerol-3-phosphate dehydrogenase subunit GlpB n=1 Tax=Edaphovirga cremea TaxID=2267246 RepID=UPI000DEF1B4E|nr:glycerol-3-phosphate dehydrogenase subunit GlpB [Edaphovirga cremea]
MQFDTVLIGGGLAGLACGIRLAERGQRCAIVSAGQSALHFSSGSLDLLGKLPDGTVVNHPLQALGALAQQAPDHPYSVMGSAAVTQLASESEQLMQRCDVPLFGHSEENHLRLTPLGMRRSTWLSPLDVPVTSLQGPIPWEQVAVIGIEGFLDFHPQLVAGSLQKAGVTASSHSLMLPALDRLRTNPSEFRAVNIARVLDLPAHREALIEELKRLSVGAQTIILPACLGLDSSQTLDDLRKQIPASIFLLPTLPPSLLGMRLYQQLRRRFQQLGGMFMPGDKALRAAIENHRVTHLYSHNHGDIPLVAKNYVLASGSFFSNGLIARFDQIIEPVFGLDIDAPSHHAQWTAPELFAPQPYLKFGVKTDRHLRAIREGNPLENLYAIGAVLGGYDPLREGCGAGVSLVSALFAAQQIAGFTEAAA